MSGGEILTAVLTFVGAIGAAVIAALNIRPKVHAEARNADTTGGVAVSADARAWVAEFRADAAAARLRAEEAERRCDDLERRFNILLEAFQACQDELRKHPGANIPTLPATITLRGNGVD
jgi:hypothetical protein